jgi:histidyl-tRNA synthetase
MEQISRSDEGEQLAKARLEALYPTNMTGLDGEHGAIDTGSGMEAHYITSLLSGISIAFGDDAARSEVIERFLWKVGRSEQRRQILHALEFLRALHAVSGPPPDVFGELRTLLQQYELDDASLAELERLVATIEQCGVPREQIVLNLSLGRGVSYYTGLVFEIHAQDEEGFDAQLCGGGRYDRLLRAVGSSRNINACGFAFGVERLLAHLPKSSLPQLETTQALVVPVSGHDMPYALKVARAARTQGLQTEVDVTGHGVSAGLKLAAKRQIRLALIVGESEQRAGGVTVRDLETGEEHLSSLDALAGQFVEKEQCL